MQIAHNYIRDGYATRGGSRGIYIDDGTSNVQVTGNIVSGIMLYENQLHGGSNDSWTGNIIDLENNTVAPIQFYQNDDTSSMTNNTFSNNIIVASMNGSRGAGYLAGNSPAGNPPPAPLAISNNAYWNYGTGGNLNRSGSGGSGSSGDSNATNENPNFTCGWEYTLPSDSPVYSPPVNFPAQPANWGQPGFWGPPGFTIPQVSTAPFPLHSH